jgi:protein TonB
MSASTANGVGVDFQVSWSRVRRPTRASVRGWGIALSLLAHVAILAPLTTFLTNRSVLTEALPEGAVELVFAPSPSEPVPLPAAMEAASAFDVVPPAEEAVTPRAPVPPVRPREKPVPPRVAVARPAPPAAPVIQAEAPLIPARPVAGMESDRPPAYPVAARRRGEQGRVVLKVDVSANGSPLDVSVVQGSGFASLDAAALGAVRQWRFMPATRGGTPIAAVAQVPIRFRLAD